MLSRLMTRKEQWVLLAFAGAIVLGAATMFFLNQEAPAPPAPKAVPVVPKQAPPLIKEKLPKVEEKHESQSPQESQSPHPAPQPQPVLAAPPAPPPPQEITVAVAGQIVSPGVYTLAEDKRVKDLISRAGGPTEPADLSDINQAARLIDGTTLTIPARREAAAANKTLRLHGRQSAAQLNPPQYTISGWQSTPAQVASAQPQVALQPQSAAPAAKSAEAQSDGLVDLNSADAEQLESLPGIGPKLAEQIIQYRDASPFSTIDDLSNVSGIGPKKLEAVRPFVTVH